MTHDLRADTRAAALAAGADLVGMLSVTQLQEHTDSVRRILPTARSVVALAARHSVASLRSANIQVAQFDTIHTYGEVERAAHGVTRFLEGKGFASVAVPAFIPLDMGSAKKGMVGELCWRRVSVRAGLGSYGENGLLVTKEFGAAVRLAGVVTTADFASDAALAEDVCDHCMRCVQVCPVAALSGSGVIDKKRCGDTVFAHGFRAFRRFLGDLVAQPPAQTRELLGREELLELWQNFMTGNYYSCFACQAQCPGTRVVQMDG